MRRRPFPPRLLRAILAACLAVPTLAAAGVQAGGLHGSSASMLAAGERLADEPEVAAALAVGRRFWDATPCGGDLVVTWTRTDPARNATARWTNPTDVWHNAAENHGCAIALNSNVDWDWPRLCTVLVHEMGHLLGHRHDPAPGRVMSAVYSTPLPDCATAPPASPHGGEAGLSGA